MYANTSFSRATNSVGATENPKKRELKGIAVSINALLILMRCNGKSQETGIESMLSDCGAVDVAEVGCNGKSQETGIESFNFA